MSSTPRGLTAVLNFPRRRRQPEFLHRLRDPQEWAEDPSFDLEAYSRSSAKPVYLGKQTALCWILGRYKILVDTQDIGLSAHLLLDGYWELWLTRFMARRVKRGMTTFDVGANFGYFTLLLGGLVGPTGRVVACEPNPVAAANLRRSVSLNGHADRTTVVEAALGAAAHPEAVLFVPNGEPKNAHMISSSGDADPTLGAICRVMQTTLDQLAAESSRIDFIKIDAEGSEEQILLGMLDTLGRHKPCLILEFNGFRSKDARALLRELMSIYGTLQYLNNDGELVGTTIEHLTEDHGNVDWLLHFDNPRRV